MISNMFNVAVLYLMCQFKYFNMSHSQFLLYEFIVGKLYPQQGVSDAGLQPQQGVH